MASSQTAAQTKAIRNFTDWRWRLENLYWITDETGKKLQFRPNWAQQKLYDEMWYLNIVLKARQLGFCLDPDTRVLTADLEWVKIGSLVPGQQVVSVDEHAPGGKGQPRKMRTAVVQGVVEVHRQAYRITFTDGRSVVCTGKHPWLSRKADTGSKWRSIEAKTKKKLIPGTQVKWITQPWDAPEYEDGWFSGLLDGEGSFRRKNGAGTEICVSQVPGAVLDRARAYLTERGYTFREEVDGRKAGDSSKLGSKPVHKLVLGRADELFRLLGQTRPSRLAQCHWWEGKELPGKKTGIGWATISSIEPLGTQTLIDLQTSTGTYIAEGFVSHNTTFIQILMLDACLFNSNTHAGTIAHNREDAERFFRDKVRYPYDNLPEGVKQMVPATEESARALSFGNNSTLRVGTSLRSGTYQWLHVSEFGKVCAKYPEKAREIVTGALNTVHVGQFVFIESTAEGQAGRFFEMCDQAQGKLRAKSKLTELDYKFHFFPWWKHSLYVLDPDAVTITQEMAEYFDKLAKMGIPLTAEQKAWYVKKAETQGDDMKREFPSTPEEAFEGAIEGAYYAHEMARIETDGRICDLPVLDIPTETWWDLGLNDTMSIAWVQRDGPWFNVIDYYENNGYGLRHYAEILAERQKARGLVYSAHVWPHDGKTRILDEEGRKRTEVMAGLGYLPDVVERGDKAEGIEATRGMLKKVRFDKTHCSKLVSAAKSYRREWDEARATFKSTPQHDWASHPADMLRTGAMYVPPDDYGDEDNLQDERERNEISGY